MSRRAKGFLTSIFVRKNAVRRPAAASSSAVPFPASAVAPSCRRSPDRRRRCPSHMDARFADRPLFAVVGCTGTGKTKLGVRLAEQLDGEVVSADSIQVYKGLDVATNKATEEETKGVPHHMMGTVDLGVEFNVHEYRDETLKIIDDVYSRGKVPVVVGGTSYYIESLVYCNNLVQRPDEETDDEGEEDDDEACEEDAERLTPSAFREYAAFRHVNDPPTADTVDGACLMYVDGLSEAVRFARAVPALGRLSRKRYRNTFVPPPAAPTDDCPSRWPPTVAECETAALYAHGVRVLDATAAACATDDRSYEVTAADVTVGSRERYDLADVRSRLDAVSRLSADDGTATAVRRALCRAHAEVEKRVQRLALALLADDEHTAVDLLAPATLKAHAAYYDPVAANELHPHNTRKVFRTIQIYLKQGKQKSKLFEEQRVQVKGSDVPVLALRFKEVHMMWLTCDDDVLNKRLDKRTDEMVERGLIEELCAFKNELTRKTGTDNMDFTKGVLQCIGVKQFQRYLELPDDVRCSEEGRAALEEALTAMKYVTKKYARRQTRWIKNRFLCKHDDKQAVSVYRLDCTDLSNWQRLSDQAVDLALVVLGRKPRSEHTLKPADVGDRKTVVPVYGDYFCNDCSRLFSNDIQYNIHMASKKHVRVMKKRKRKLQDSTLRCDSDSNCDSDSKFNSQKQL